MVAGWGAAGEQCPAAGREARDPPLPPHSSVPMAAVTRGGSRDGLCCLHRPCPGRCGAVAWEGGMLG